jgi:two-component system CheB/CheR fusion protein
MAGNPHQLRILVVDDNVDGADMLALLLSDEGHEVRTAYTGREAMDAASRQRPDVIFLDIGLPELNGYEVARLLRADVTLSDTYIVAVTAYGTPADKAAALAVGIDAHLTKPVEPPTIYAALEKARLGRGTKAPN